MSFYVEWIVLISSINYLFIPSPTKLQRDIVMLRSVLPSFRNILVNILESTNLVHA